MANGGPSRHQRLSLWMFVVQRRSLPQRGVSSSSSSSFSSLDWAPCHSPRREGREGSGRAVGQVLARGSRPRPQKRAVFLPLPRLLHRRSELVYYNISIRNSRGEILITYSGVEAAFGIFFDKDIISSPLTGVATAFSSSGFASIAEELPASL